VPDFQEVHTFDTMPESNACRSMHLVYDRRYTQRVSGGPLWSCSFSPSSVRLVTCDGSEKVKLWDVNSGNLLARLQAGGPVDCCSFSECGLFIAAYKKMENDQCDEFDDNDDQCDEFTVWYALTLQRVDRRISHLEEMDTLCDGRLFLHCFFYGRNNDSEFLLSCDGGCINLFQSHDGLFVFRLARAGLRNFPRHTTIRYHWRFCVLYHTNELIKFPTALQDNQFVYFIYCSCPCDSEVTRLARLAPVSVQKLYVVPFVNKLDIFSVADQPSISIQPSFVSKPYFISCCCFSPDGSFLATCANGDPLSVLIWDTKLCTVIQVVRLPLLQAEGCWWSERLLWIYDMDVDVLMKIPISNGRTLDPSSAGMEEIDWEPRKFLTFSDVLIFIDQENSVNVARIKNGELQYVEKLPVDKSILCAAVSPCNSIILMVSWELTFHVWKEDQTSHPLHWVASNTGELLDFSGVKGSEEIDCCKCCITSDSTKGVLVLYFNPLLIRKTFPFLRRAFSVFRRALPQRQHPPPASYYLIFVDLNPLSSKITTMMFPDDDYFRYKRFKLLTEIYAGNSYCVVADERDNCYWLDAVKLATGEYVAKWRISDEFINDGFNSPTFIVAHSRNDIVAVITQRPASVRFWKIVVPE
jgi:WD40 repeat protein